MSQTPNPQQPQPSVRPTRPATLFVAALAAAAVAWLLISRFYYSLPPNWPWLPALTLAALAVGEAVAAYGTKARIERKPGREPVEPLIVARLLALAKASSLAGAIFAGFYLGMSTWLLIERQRNDSAAQDLPAVLATFAASVVLVAAALWLERSCRIPKQPDESDKMPSDQIG